MPAVSHLFLFFLRRERGRSEGKSERERGDRYQRALPYREVNIVVVFIYFSLLGEFPEETGRGDDGGDVVTMRTWGRVGTHSPAE